MLDHTRAGMRSTGWKGLNMDGPAQLQCGRPQTADQNVS
jgi:hypothetical protein